MDEVHHIEPVYETKTISDFEKYKKEYAESIARPAHFWSEQATRRLTWERPFDPHAVLQGSFDHGDVTWFRGGKLNVCFNAIDRHVNSKTANELAMVWEGDEPDDIRRITYAEMLRKVSQIANALAAEGVKKGDVVTIYMPMIPGKFTDTLFVCTLHSDFLFLMPVVLIPRTCHDHVGLCSYRCRSLRCFCWIQQ